MEVLHRIPECFQTQPHLSSQPGQSEIRKPLNIVSPAGRPSDLDLCFQRPGQSQNPQPNQHHLCHLPASAPAVLPDAWSVSEFRNQINSVTSFVSSTGLCAHRASGCLVSLRIRNQINIICVIYRPPRPPCFRTPDQSQNPKPNQHHLCHLPASAPAVLPDAWSVSESATKSTSFVSSTGLRARRASGRLISLRIRNQINSVLRHVVGLSSLSGFETLPGTGIESCHLSVPGPESCHLSVLSPFGAGSGKLSPFGAGVSLSLSLCRSLRRSLSLSLSRSRLCWPSLLALSLPRFWSSLRIKLPAPNGYHVQQVYLPKLHTPRSVASALPWR